MGVGDTFHVPGDHLMREVQCLHSGMDETPGDTVKSFAKVYFQAHSSTSLLKMVTFDQVMGEENVVTNGSTWDKSRLQWIDDFFHNQL